MKKFLFPIIIFFTFLASANVQSRILFTLAIAEIIFAAMMILLSLYQKSKLSASPEKSSLHLQKNENYDCRIKIDNNSFLPVNRFRLLVSDGYDGSGEMKKTYLYGGSDTNGGYLRFSLENPLCGINRIKAEKLKCYDWLLLSSFTKELDRETVICVLPDPERHIRFIYPAKNEVSENVSVSGEMMRRSTGSDEFSDIRPYRQGDPLRFIYWKQSAKMGELWVREYDEDIHSFPVLEVRAADIEISDVTAADAFYRLLYAALSGLLFVADSFAFAICFPSGTRDIYLIKNREVLQGILVALYKNDLSLISDLYVSGQVNAAFTLTVSSDLELYLDGKLIKKYDADYLDTQIDEDTVDLQEV